ncbi:MAG: hypothetical protein BJ554DRAFT_265 [Olpidium bornovanus]|uniref:Uncharacterized protein n=1 Tax=Olpidium bornovanus TaxID=278681 RepID=A0A8H7ZU07_9FUNG|nr:MAG: hypothetical protein BJ554DRAFT_265 [Olpidium bornovanus]
MRIAETNLAAFFLVQAVAQPFPNRLLPLVAIDPKEPASLTNSRRGLEACLQPAIAANKVTLLSAIFHSIVDETLNGWYRRGRTALATVANSFNNSFTTAFKKGANGKVDNTIRRVCLDPCVINHRLPDDCYPIPLITYVVE